MEPGSLVTSANFGIWRHTGTPWITSRDTARLLDFVKEAFGAKEGWPGAPGT
jgi:hypothetical protein